MAKVDPLETTGKSFHPNGIPGSVAHAYRARAKGADRPTLPIFFAVRIANNSQM